MNNIIRKWGVFCVLSVLFLVGGLVVPERGFSGPPSPPCPGCMGKPSVPSPLYFLQPQPLVPTPVKNGMEWDGSSLWMTTLGGVRFQATIPTTGITGTQLSNPFTWPTNYTVIEPDGTKWLTGGPTFPASSVINFPDGSVWNTGGLTFGTGGTEKMPDGSTWNSSGLTIPIGKTITNNGTISGGTINPNTINVNNAITNTEPTALGQLAPGALTNSSFTSIYMNTTYTPGTSASTIPINTISIDNLSEYNTTSYKFTPKNTGWYLIHFTALINGTSTATFTFKLVNSTTAIGVYVFGQGQTPYTQEFTSTWIGELIAGDAYIFQSSSSSGTIAITAGNIDASFTRLR